MLSDWFDVRGLLLFFLIFTPLEYLIPIHKKADYLRRGMLTDIAHFFVSGIFIRFGLAVVIVISSGIGGMIVPLMVSDTLHSLPLWIQIILSIVIADFGFYFAHRAMHTFPFLWHFHAVHHSSEQLDWLAAYRVHPIDQVLVKGASLVPIYMLGFSASAILISALIFHWQALFIHSNIRIPVGPLRHLIAGPEFHHWHHANDATATNKNFSGQLPLWDRIFRTLHMPGRMPVRYGVDEVIPSGYLAQLLYPFRQPVDDIDGYRIHRETHSKESLLLEEPVNCNDRYAKDSSAGP